MSALSDVVPPGLLVPGTSASIKIAKPFSPSADLRKVVHDPEANPLALADGLDQATQREWHGWLPEVVQDYCHLRDSDVQQLDKVLAVQVCLTNPDVFEDWTLFHHTTTAFNHRRVSFEWLDQLSVLELAWATTVIRALAPGLVFGPGIRRYLGAVCLDAGLLVFPWVGGASLSLCTEPWSRGLVDPDCDTIAKQVQAAWEAGELQELAPSDVEHMDPLHVQMHDIVAAQAYIRAQKPRDPGSYR